MHPHYPTILLCKKFAAVTQISDGIAVGYEDIKSIQYFGENIEAYWRKDGDDFSMMVRKALDEHDQVLAKVAAFEEDLLAKANAISAKYADLLSLAYRQTIAGHKLTWHEGKLQFFSKENYSNGCIATVDVTYPSMPLFLLYAPDLVEGMLDPVFKMIEKGMWGPTAYLDRGNDILFRSQKAADDYFAAKQTAAQKQTAAAAEEAAPQEKEGYESMLQAIRRANDRIDDPVLTAKIHRLEAITGQIFKVIREEPAKKNKANTFLNYYLPTTQKLLDSYADFEETGVSGQNLDQAKVRIEETMDNIIAGFEHQLDELYRDAAMDIDSDIRVMETMLRRDTATAADDFGLDGGTAVQTPDTEIE